MQELKSILILLEWKISLFYDLRNDINHLYNMRVFEFWAIDEKGNKWNEYVQSKSRRSNKVKEVISKKFNIDIPIV